MNIEGHYKKMHENKEHKYNKHLYHTMNTSMDTMKIFRIVLNFDQCFQILCMWRCNVLILALMK